VKNNKSLKEYWSIQTLCRYRSDNLRETRRSFDRWQRKSSSIQEARLQQVKWHERCRKHDFSHDLILLRYFLQHFSCSFSSFRYYSHYRSSQRVIDSLTYISLICSQQSSSSFHLYEHRSKTEKREALRDIFNSYLWSNQLHSEKRRCLNLFNCSRQYLSWCLISSSVIHVFEWFDTSYVSDLRKKFVFRMLMKNLSIFINRINSECSIDLNDMFSVITVFIYWSVKYSSL
jgi:hypothetical protein